MTPKERAVQAVTMLDLPPQISDDIKQAMLTIIDSIPDGAEDIQCGCEECKMYSPKRKKKVIR